MTKTRTGAAPPSPADDPLADMVHDFWTLVDHVCERHGIPLQPADPSAGRGRDGDLRGES